MAVPRAPILRKQVALDVSGPQRQTRLGISFLHWQKQHVFTTVTLSVRASTWLTPGRLRLMFTSRPMALHQIHRTDGKNPQETL